jgi:hypothetical protein
MEIDFDDILNFKEPTNTGPKPAAQTDVKLKQTETRARQQSCMIHEVDKDLVMTSLLSCPPTLSPLSKTSESAFPICSIWYCSCESG